VTIRTSDGIPVFTTSNVDGLDQLTPLAQGEHSFSFSIPASFLAAGRYTLTLGLQVPGTESFAAHPDILAFDVHEGVNHASKFNDYRQGIVTPLFDWKHSFTAPE
jgi:hypothetical protein